jgi:hypothetical protein
MINRPGSSNPLSYDDRGNLRIVARCSDPLAPLMSPKLALAVSDEQLSAVFVAAIPLPPERRSAFLERLAENLDTPGAGRPLLGACRRGGALRP